MGPHRSVASGALSPTPADLLGLSSPGPLYPVPGTVRRHRGWTFPSVSNLGTAGLSLPALAAGLGGEEPRLVPGGHCPACAARAAGGRGRNGTPRPLLPLPGAPALGRGNLLRPLSQRSQEAETVLAPKVVGFKFVFRWVWRPSLGRLISCFCKTIRTRLRASVLFFVYPARTVLSPLVNSPPA